MIHDAIHLLAQTIESNYLVDVIPEYPKASCENEIPWSYGNEFLVQLRKIKFTGLSGYIEFDENTGYRKNVTLAIVDKTRSGVDLVGFWRDYVQDNPIEIVRSYAKEKDQVMDKLNRNLIITTKLVRKIFFYN